MTIIYQQGVNRAAEQNAKWLCRQVIRSLALNALFLHIIFAGSKAPHTLPPTQHGGEMKDGATVSPDLQEHMLFTSLLIDAIQYQFDLS